MSEKKRDEEVGALWEKRGAKGPFLTGTVLETPVICFPVESTNPQAPTWRIYKSRPREGTMPASSVIWPGEEL